MSLPALQQPAVARIFPDMNTIHTISSYLLNILIFSSDLLLGLPSCHLPADFLTNNLYAFICSSTCALLFVSKETDYYLTFPSF